MPKDRLNLETGEEYGHERTPAVNRSDVKVIEDGDRVRVEVGITMADGEPRYSFDFDPRKNGCVQIRCGVTAPADSMHICDLIEFRKAIDAAVATAETFGVDFDK